MGSNLSTAFNSRIDKIFYKKIYPVTAIEFDTFIFHWEILLLAVTHLS